MENTPRYGQEQPEENSSDTDATDTRGRRTRFFQSEGYLSRFIREPEPPEAARDTSKESEDDDDEDDDGDSSKDKAPVRRYKRLRKGGLLKRSLARPEFFKVDKAEPKTEVPAVDQTPPDYYETWNPDAVDAIVRTSEDSAREAPAEMLEEIVDAVQEEGGELTISHTSETEDAESEPVTRIDIPQPEPESVQAILERSRSDLEPAAAEQLEERTLDLPEVGGYTVVEQKNITNTHETHIHENRNTGLHLLNYHLARRRDKRNQAENNRRFNSVDRTAEDMRKAQAETMKEVKKITQQYERTRPVEQVTNSTSSQEIYNDNRSNVINKTTNNIEKRTEITENKVDATKQETPKIETKNYVSNEQFIEQVNRADEQKGGIDSEFNFERRHEVKDVPSESMSAMTAKTGLAPDPDQFQQTQQAMPQPSSQQPTPVQSTNTNNDAVKEVVTTGIWGAVVGVAIFIIIYVLTRG